ncbi:hypothetical protein EMMF5_001245 [Cystobasidiomycetes sp. EMM_F5]
MRTLRAHITAVRRNKVDISKLTPAEQQAFRMYGKLPSRPVARNQERKYFDSGDHALAKAGKVSMSSLGKERPTPDAIPHASPTPVSSVTSPTSATGSGSPPTGTPLGTPMGSIPFGSSVNPVGTPAGSIPIGGGQTSPSAVQSSTFPAPESSINMSMSPGRIGVGQSLATSPSRSTGSFPIHSQLAGASAPNAGGQSGLVNRLEREASATSPTTSTGSIGQPQMVSATTGNQVGKQQMRRTSDSEGTAIGGTSSPPPTSGLAQSFSAHESAAEDQVDGMELH